MKTAEEWTEVFMKRLVYTRDNYDLEELLENFIMEIQVDARRLDAETPMEIMQVGR